MEAKIALIGLQGEARFTQIFSVELLYRLMADVKFAQILEASGCDLPEFYRLVGKVDALGMAAETRALERIQGLKAEYDWAAGQIDRWKKECERQTERTQYWKDKCGVKEERAQHWKTQYKHMAEEATLRFQIRKRLSALWRLR
jgi:hypothetical protein